MYHSASSTSLPDRNAQANWLQTRPGERCLIRVPAADANGAYSLVEIVSDPGDATPLHVHQNEDEYLLVLEGTARFALGDRVFDAEAGTMVTLPKRFLTPGATARVHGCGSRGFVIPAALRKPCASLPAAA